MINKFIIQLKYFLMSILFCGSCFATDPQKSPIVIFISFSMPTASIKATLDDAAKINAPVVIRGLVDNSFKKTISQIYEITQEKNHSLEINPEAFKEYGIQNVPAVLIRNNNHFQIMIGDVALSDVLAELSRKDNDLALIAQNALEKLKRATRV